MCENKYLHSNYLVAILMSMNWLAVYCTEKASKVGWGYYTEWPNLSTTLNKVIPMVGVVLPILVVAS